jgi:ATP-dependent DNA helicase RecG
MGRTGQSLGRQRPLSSTIGWDARLATVAGKRASKIEKAFGYRTVGDLLGHYPRRWVGKGSLSDLGAIEPDAHVTVIARVVSSEQFPYADRRRGGSAYRLEAVVATEDAHLVLTFFDKARHRADWRRRQLSPGRTGLFSGKVGTFRGRLQLVNPQTELFGGEGDEATVAAAWEKLPKLISIYPATATVQSWQLADVIELAGAALAAPARQLGAEGGGRQAAAVRRGVRRADRALPAPRRAGGTRRAPPHRT